MVNDIIEYRILCFIPSNMNFLVSEKFILYKGNQLKTAYLGHIMNELLTKYTLTGEYIFTIWSKILQELYGKYYARYVEYLVDNNILLLFQNKQVGKTSRRYKLNMNFIKDEKIRRCEFYDKFLHKKINNRKLDTTFDSLLSSPITEMVRLKMINDLDNVELDCERATIYLNSIKDNISIDSYLKNSISISHIYTNDIYYKFDCYGRMHTNFTTLKRHIRKNYLTIHNEPVFEIDIKNSQPFFLAILMKKYYNNNKIPDGIKYYIDLVFNGLFYEDFLNNINDKKIDREDVKKYTYKVLFGKNINNKINLLFKKHYPIVFEFILQYKEDLKDYKKLSHKLQRLESDFIYNKVINDIMILYPDITLITVHDSIIAQYKYKKEITEIFNRNMRILKNT